MNEDMTANAFNARQPALVGLGTLMQKHEDFGTALVAAQAALEASGVEAFYIDLHAGRDLTVTEAWRARAGLIGHEPETPLSSYAYPQQTIAPGGTLDRTP